MSGSGHESSGEQAVNAGQPTRAMLDLVDVLGDTQASTKPGINYVDANVYLDSERFVRERDALFLSEPVPLLPSAMLASGQSVTHDHYGVPLVVTRDKSGQIHVLVNVCQHRGTRLVEECRVQSVSRLVCPYHAWTYRLDGTLQGLPRSDTFPGLEREHYGLKRFDVIEAGGLIWTRLDGAKLGNNVLGLIADDFDALDIGGAVVFDSQTHEVNANWKLIVDAFLESYHVQRLHKGSIGPFFADAVTASARVGHHFRSAVARRDYQKVNVTDSLESMRCNITFSYSLFPAAVVVVSPDYINIMLIYPSRVNKTIVEDYMLIPNAPQSDEEREHWSESFKLLDGGVFAAEDFRAAELGQKGLETGLIEKLTIGTAEYGLAEFHSTVDNLLRTKALS